MKTHHVLFVIYFETISIRSPDAFQTTSSFKHVEENKDKYPTANVLQEFPGTVSLSRCTASCLRYSECSSVFYNDINQMCVCAGQVDSSDLTPSPGYVQLSKNHSDTSDWVLFGNSQYLILRKNSNWIEAQIECATFGARLAEIETTEENNFLRGLIRAAVQDTVFLGGTEVFDEGSWIWYSTLRNVSFTDWASTKPDYGGTDHCLTLHAFFDFAWDDNPCGYRLNNILCERVVV
ncbi:C-type lectin domain family 4 member M-like [Saccostrea cucullata]|uniref:C-type lectin domain family 4 member M-like n=1 Tax=Saccostrea cuccullata TaxID=36930 RepID=UPI002ED5238F